MEETQDPRGPLHLPPVSTALSRKGSFSQQQNPEKVGHDLEKHLHSQWKTYFESLGFIHLKNSLREMIHPNSL